MRGSLCAAILAILAGVGPAAAQTAEVYYGRPYYFRGPKPIPLDAPYLPISPQDFSMPNAELWARYWNRGGPDRCFYFGCPTYYVNGR